jgi:hypothetical protein
MLASHYHPSKYQSLVQLVEEFPAEITTEISGLNLLNIHPWLADLSLFSSLYELKLCDNLNVTPFKGRAYSESIYKSLVYWCSNENTNLMGRHCNSDT